MLHRITLMAFLLCFLLTGSAAAQESTAPYPTVTALEATLVPINDPVQLARWFRGVEEIAPRPQEVPKREIGEVQRFWVTGDDGEFEVEAELIASGEHIYFWVEVGARLDANELNRLAQDFDRFIYPQVRALYGSENTPGIDGDPRVYGLFAYGIGSTTLAYYAGRHSYPDEVYPTSNEHEMLFFNLDMLEFMRLDDSVVESTVAHEFQHMIRAQVQDNEDTWMNEGFSTFTELLLFGTRDFEASFLARPQTQLNTWGEISSNRLPNYGAAKLFITYFYERFGLEALQQLSADPHTGLEAVDAVLRARGQGTVESFFADWVVANYVLDPGAGDGRFGYRLLGDGLIRPPMVDVVQEYPYDRTRESNQYAADYYVLSDLDDSGITTLQVRVEMEPTVPLVPTVPTSGDWMWYSNKGDQSLTTLTRAFDLTGLERATLEYAVWYDLEDDYDYGYVMVSADEGASWTILETEHSNSDNPFNVAYGPGYTGESLGWINERLELDAYVGQSVLIRFAMITDDAITQPGLVVDDVRIPELGYADDFEAGADGWVADGWVRVDNRLPQQMWVQAIQYIGDDMRLSRWLAPAEMGWDLPLDPAVDEVVLVLSPFAPVTTVPMRYTLHVEG
jgi:immune inhibitor A